MTAFAGPLRTRGLRLLVTGSTVSLLGDGVYSVAMAVVALRTPNPASTLAAVAVAGLVPRIVFGLWGGVLADRVSRRLILLAADLVRLAVVLVLGLVLLHGTPPLWVLLACVVPLGAATGAAAPAFGAILPDVVEADELVAANSVMGSVSPFAQMMLGPALGGVLAAYDVPLAMFVDAGTFAVSAVCVLRLRPARQHEGRPHPLPWAHFREGIDYVRRTPWLLVNLLCGVAISFAVSGAFTMLPFLVTRGYGAPGASFGYLLAVGGAVATLTAVVVGSLRPRKRPLTSSYAMYVAGLAAVVGLGVAPDVWVAVPFVALMFAGTTAGNIWQDSVLGTRIPRELRGRVSSLDWVSATVSAPLSITVSAALVTHVGIRATFVGAGVAAGLGSLVGLALLLRSGEPQSTGPQRSPQQANSRVSRHAGLPRRRPACHTWSTAGDQKRRESTSSKPRRAS
ncbi:MAG: MFS transporter [Actinomycetes bacterium]